MNQLESSVQQRRVGYLCLYKSTGNKYELGKGPKRNIRAIGTWGKEK